MGCYLHGLFAADEFRHAYLKRFRTERAQSQAYEQQVDDVLDLLAEHCEKHMDIESMIALATK
ncbi:MAG: cobyric acid synthase CobQ, partial [Alphaproteobacteria bacterium]|nr:cobyric acid synthase CobQ [Alphaproteobacteria bacterium]